MVRVVRLLWKTRYNKRDSLKRLQRRCSSSQEMVAIPTILMVRIKSSSLSFRMFEKSLIQGYSQCPQLKCYQVNQPITLPLSLLQRLIQATTNLVKVRHLVSWPYKEYQRYSGQSIWSIVNNRTTALCKVLQDQASPSTLLLKEGTRSHLKPS
jgi:hypothetical protein